ncbi:MAG: TetR/AcrR family transcriptional regulator [Nautiliaceae bacterium]
MDTKSKILKEALELFAKRGYENASLDEIAKRVGISKPAIYYYFKSKKRLYNEVFRSFFEGFEIELSGDIDKDLEDYIKRVFLLFKNKNLAKLFLRELSNGMENLEDETLKRVSFLLRTLSLILKDLANPFFIQTLIISSILTYINTMELREKVGGMVNVESNFDLQKELKEIILKYVREHK